MVYFVPHEVRKLLYDTHLEEAKSGLEVGDLEVKLISGLSDGIRCGVEEGSCKGGVSSGAALVNGVLC